MKFWQLFFKATALAVVIAALLLALTGAVVAFATYRKAERITRDAGFSLHTLVAEARSGWNQQPSATDDRKNILILGTDTLSTRPGSPALTDAMLLVSINLKTGVITGLALPRDLWSDEYKTKLNALYSYGEERYPGQPEKFPTQVLSDLTGVPIHHTLVVSMDSLSTLVDAVGGIEVNVVQGFTDTAFPRPDVDVTKVTDPDALYMTVQFDAGVQHMSGERVLQYVRSRHAQGDEGTDTARSMRQQHVIEALMAKLQDRSTLTNEQTLTKLLALYRASFQPVIGVSEGVATLRRLMAAHAQPSFQTVSLTIYPEDEHGVITHPENTRGKAYANQWVYIVRDPQTLRDFVKSALLQ